MCLFCYAQQICDMVAIARYLNVTLVVPELDKTSFWADPRCVNFSMFWRFCTGILILFVFSETYC